MRTTKILVISLIAAMGAFTAQAQYKDNAIKFNIGGAIVKQYQFAYERAINEQLSLQLSAGIIDRDWGILDSDLGDFSQNGFLVIPEARYYFEEGEALKGAYAAAFMRYRQTQWVFDDLITDIDGFDNSWTDTRSVMGGGLVLGYQALISDALVIDVAIGPQYKSVSKSFEYTELNYDPTFDPDFDRAEKEGVSVRFSFDIGYAF
jgi:hypothetical protein